MTTELSIHPDMTIHAITERFPATIAVLARHGIDRCCGGQLTLVFVSQAHRLDLDTLLKELGEAG